MNITPVLGIEEVSWGAANILRTVYTCNVKNVEYDLWKNHEFIYDSHYKILHQTKCCGVLIDNRDDAPICVLEDKERESKKQLDLALKEFFGGKCHVENVYKITSC